MTILEATQLFKDYQSGSLSVRALRGIDLSVNVGEFLAIMGPSGCGKSTLLHVVGGIEPPTSGQVVLEGAELGAMSDNQRSIIRRRKLGFVFQKMNLLPTLAAVENVALPLRIDGVPPRQARSQAAEALEQVDIGHRAAHFPHEISGGEQQRVAIARALVMCPAIIFADEPTGSLDSANGQHIIDLLRQCSNRGQTIVMVTHDTNLADQADRVLRMQDGKMVTGQIEPADGSSSRFLPTQGDG